jgi:hypothetical protein
MSDKPDKRSESTRQPQQEHFVPKTRARSGQRSWSEGRAHRRSPFYHYVGTLLLLVALPVGIVWYFSSVDKSDKDAVDNSTDGSQSTKQLDFLLNKGSGLQLEKHYHELDSEIATGQIPRQLAAFKDRLRIADELIRRDQDERLVRFAIMAKLSTLSSLAAFDRAFDHREKRYDAELLAYCEQFTFDNDPVIRNKANVCEFAAHIQNYLRNPTDQEFAKLESKVDMFVSAITTEEQTVELIPDFFVPLMSKSQNSTHVNNFNARLAEHLQNSDQPVFRNAGDRIMDKIVFGTPCNWDNLRVLIRANDQTTVNKLESLVALISDEPDVSVSTYSNILSCIEFLEPEVHKDLRISLINRVRSTVANITNEDKREQVVDLIDRYVVRDSLIGKPFDLRSELVENSALPDKAPSVVLFVSSASPDRNELIENLKSLDQLVPLTNRYIIVYTDSKLTEEVGDQLKLDFPNGILIGPEEKDSFLEQCPITHVPYIIILDRNGRVAAINVDISQVRNHLSTLNKVDE